MSPESSAEYLQAGVREARLNTTVPEGVRRSFERVCDLHVCGLFKYGFFTLADQAAWMLPESALGLRFIERYGGKVPFVRKGEVRILETATFGRVVDAVGYRGSFSRRSGWRLDGHAHYGNGRSFDGGYWALLQWARREGLLTSWLNEKWAQSEHGVRSGVLTHVRPPDYSVPDDWGGFDEGARARWWAEFRANIWESDQIDMLVELRNLIVHSEPGRVVMPVDSARSLVSVAQLINHLWPDPESIGRPNPHV